VQTAVGHSSPEETLRTYTHLWPDTDDRTRDAVAALLAVEDDATDGRRDSRGLAAD
jgi:hypothetical protein